MSKIPFNSFLNLNYSNSFEELFSDYDNFRNKIFSNKCLDLLKPEFPNADVYLTHSATGALEMIALLIDIKPGDEIILPSFTFVSTANAFVSKGAVPVFVDIREEDFNIDPDLVEKAITAKTKAIIAVHYAGNACQMDQLMEIATRHRLFLIEDAAMGFGCEFKGKSLGSIGHFGVISFDITKQLTAVQGGLCIINDDKFKKRAANVYHIGTNRIDFQNGNSPYYEWVDVGSKFQMNELGAVVLYEQLRVVEQTQKALDALFYEYLDIFQNSPLANYLPRCFLSNASLPKFKHSFFLILESEEQRNKLMDAFKKNEIEAFFHYYSLHESKFYRTFSNNISKLPTSEKIEKCIVRFPFYNQLVVENPLFLSGILIKIIQ
jgi:dTDP-4-amino-4,6-dideoxygalactose transaminase